MSAPTRLPASVGVLTVSDRAHAGTYTDLGGPAVLAYISTHFSGPPATSSLLVPDEISAITAAIKSLAASHSLVLTTGGTGPAPRDVTPEATAAACAKMLPGFGEAMRAASIAKVPTSILSRASAGVCRESLVVNLPGSVKAIDECLDAVLHAIPHAVRLVGGGELVIAKAYHREGAFCKDCDVNH